jgi:hypothetical protein
LLELKTYTKGDTLKVTERIAKKRTEIKVKFAAGGLTAHGGLILVEELIHRLRVKEIIEETVSVKKRQRGYQESDHILALVYNLIGGGSCLDDLNLLREDAETKAVIQQEAIPHATTAGDFLRAFTLGHIKQLEKASRRIQEQVHSQEDLSELTLDIDSALFEQYSSKKQGSCTGYNGETGYHPQFGFRADTGEWVYGRLQRGGAYTSADAEQLLAECLKRVPKSVKRVKTRSDSGWYKEGYLAACEGCTTHVVIYTITADQTKPLLEKIAGIKEWIPMSTEAEESREVAEFWYRGVTWKKGRRFIVKREPRFQGKEKQLHLFPEEGYRYYVLVTNSEEADIIELMEFHMGRGNAENYIKELLYGFDLEQLPSERFHANWVYLLIGQLAYNLVVWLKQYGLPKKYLQSRVKLIRHRFLYLAGRIVRSGRVVWLNLQQGYRYQQEFLDALVRLRSLEFA